MRVVANPDPWTKVFGAYLTRAFFKAIKAEDPEDPEWYWGRYIYSGLSQFDVSDKMTR